MHKYVQGPMKHGHGILGDLSRCVRDSAQMRRERGYSPASHLHSSFFFLSASLSLSLSLSLCLADISDLSHYVFL